jgi:endonuclease/exonuclease/phosphatase family metal-dependent hydrolase
VIVASYNVHRCLGGDGRRDPDRIAAVIDEMGADVVGLQEVDASVHPRFGVDQFAHLARATRSTAIAGPTLRSHRGRYGNVLLTHVPVVGVRLIDLSVPGREPRGAIDADLEVDGARIRVVVTHLGLRGAERRRQVVRLLRRLEEPRVGLALVLGDLNEWLAPARVLRCLRARFAGPAVRSFPARLPLIALDRVLVQPPGALVDVHAHGSRLARVASDHLPVRAVVRVPPELGRAR